MQESVVIGSDSKCDIVVKEPGMSAQHASIDWKRNQVFCKALVRFTGYITGNHHASLAGGDSLLPP